MGAARHAIKAPMADPFDYINLLEACIASKLLRQGKTIHQQLLKNDGNSPNALDKLTRLYITCNKLELAHRTFSAIPCPQKRDRVILWNQIIQAYSREGPFRKAIDLYREMVETGVTPSKYTYPFVLKACSGLQDTDIGKQVHDHVKTVGLQNDVYISTALVDFYAKCGCLGEARQLFDEMTNRDLVAWNAMIAGSSLHGLFTDTMKLVAEMQQSALIPNSSTVVSILPAIGEACALGQGKALHCYCVRRGFDDNVMVGTGLLDMYGKCGILDYARRIFNVMVVKNEVTWSAMIGACITCDSTREGLELYDRMVAEDDIHPSPVMLSIVLRGCAKLTDLNKGRQIHSYTIKCGFLFNIMVGNTMLSMYAKCGIIDEAMKFFDGMEDIKDTVSYSAIISGCVQNGHSLLALHIFRKMQFFGINPDSATMIGFLPACSHLAALQQGACAHSYSIVHGYTKTDTSICNALIDMYAKCGKIDMARCIFDSTHKRDIVSWNAMIVGYGTHGIAVEALSLFHDMQSTAVGLKPDEVTFIGLLSACSHSGLVEEGMRLFDAMIHDFNIVPRMEHYLCMVDLNGRAGLLNEAQSLIERMPFEPDVRIWSALLSACRIHKNIELAEKVSIKIHSLGPESSGNFVVLSNLYSCAGRWDDAAHIRLVQRGRGFKKSPGCSWIEINGVVHAFVGGDQSHPQSSQINEKLGEMVVEMKKLGYHAEPGFVYQDVEEEEKELILVHHSEKLAVAFGILSLAKDKPILVTKNLRVCGDCHLALKYISMITRREITVRDASRFHHFRDGTCNCGDYW